jgi:hypothetical protein
VRYSSDKGIITDIQIYSDALDADEVERIGFELKGKALAALDDVADGESEMFKDVVGLF